jgi:hypothetical protein
VTGYEYPYVRVVFRYGPTSFLSLCKGEIQYTFLTHPLKLKVEQREVETRGR